MQILGIDLGKKRVGLAWIDTAIGVVLPFGVINQTGEVLEKELRTIIQKEHIDTVVLGLPLNLQGEETEGSVEARRLGKILETEAGVRVVFEDERFTSRLADTMGGDASRDEKAAMAILQGFIDRSS